MFEDKPAVTKPISIDDYARARDYKGERREIRQSKEIQTKTLVLDAAKCHVMLMPVCKECRNEWVAMFVLENGDKQMACPRCKKVSSIGVRSGNPAKPRVIS